MWVWGSIFVLFSEKVICNKDINQKVDELFNQSWSESLNTMKEENPWDISSMFDLAYFCCPECDCKSQSKQDFIIHASNDHPWVSFCIYFQQQGPSKIQVEGCTFNWRTDFQHWSTLCIYFFPICHSDLEISRQK